MFHLSFCLILTAALFSAPTNADCDEKAFFELYGNNTGTSGVWQAVRNISSDAAKLRILCERAHNHTGSPDTDVIDTIGFEPKTLTFTRYDDRWSNKAPIQVDVVSYNVTRQPPHSNSLRKHQFFHFTKGVKEGCIFYVVNWRYTRPLFRVGYHLCDVEVPV